MTKEQYIESLRKLNLKVYFMGESNQQPCRSPDDPPVHEFSGHDLWIGWKRWVQDAHDGKIQSYRKNS